MMSLDAIKNFYPDFLRSSATAVKHILKEYVQLLVLDHLATTQHARKLTFIGGTCLRFTKGIDRFSEDLDFDCRALDEQEFRAMADGVVLFLVRNGLKAEIREKDNSRLTAFRSSIYFPGLLFDLRLTGHRDERFMLKLEAQDQGVDYERVTANIRGCGLFFPFPVPPDPVLCSMKLSALLSRCKGRDCYDVMFLLQQTAPDYSFLTARNGIHDLPELKSAVQAALEDVDLNQKRKDVEHLLFHRDNSERILRFREFIQGM
jgi:predicted nucleotidyltransferase component of viral defense system